MSVEPDPPRKFFQLKPREFEAVNRLPDPPVEPVVIVPKSPVDEAPTARISVQDHLLAASTPGPVLSPGARLTVENEVHAILRGNLEHANAAGLNEVKPKPRRKSRRKRDYWLLMTCAGAVFGTTVVTAGPANAIPFVYGLAGLVISVVGLTWIMWFLMDDY